MDMAMQSEMDTRERIILVAERLFALKGLDGTSLREVARASSVNVNLIAHYFSTKNNLFATVVDRRAKVLNYERERLLNELDGRYSPQTAPVLEILRTFVRPFIILQDDDPDGWANWVRLLNRESGGEAWRAAMSRNLVPSLKRYTSMLHRAMPSASRTDVLFVVELATQSLLLLTEIGVSALLSDALQERPMLEARILNALAAAAEAVS